MLDEQRHNPPKAHKALVTFTITCTVRSVVRTSLVALASRRPLDSTSVYDIGLEARAGGGGREYSTGARSPADLDDRRDADGWIVICVNRGRDRMVLSRAWPCSHKRNRQA